MLAVLIGLAQRKDGDDPFYTPPAVFWTAVIVVLGGMLAAHLFR